MSHTLLKCLSTIIPVTGSPHKFWVAWALGYNLWWGSWVSWGPNKSERGVHINYTHQNTKLQSYEIKLIIFKLILDNILHKKYSDRVWSINKHGWLVNLNYLYALLNYHNTFGFNLLLQSKTNNIWPIQACIGSTNERWYKIYNSPVMKGLELVEGRTRVRGKRRVPQQDPTWRMVLSSLETLPDYSITPYLSII